MEPVPGWLARRWLVDALNGVGLPWVPAAVWTKTDDSWMSLADRHAAVDMAARVWIGMRRRIPLPAPASALGDEWRAAVWRCTVAGLAAIASERRAGEAEAAARRPPAKPCGRPIPMAMVRRMARPVNPAASSAQAAGDRRFTIHRRGEVRRA